MRDSFIFYRSFYEAIKELPRDIQGEIYTAIMEYSLNGNETDSLKPVARGMFTLIKPQIDKNNTKYENGLKGSEHGKKGGRPPKSETPKKPLKNPNLTPNDNVNDNVNDNNSNTDVLLRETSKPHAESIDYKLLVDFFNTETKGVFGVVHYPLSDKRKKMINARIREHGKQMFCQAIKLAYQSDFLKGQGGRDFNASFDWIIKPTNFEKIISGNYENKDKRNPPEAGIDIGLANAILEGANRGQTENR